MEMPNLINTLHKSTNPFSLSLQSPKTCTYSLNFSFFTRRCVKQLRVKKPFNIRGLSASLKGFINGDMNSYSEDRNDDMWADSGCVEVIGIGNRVDSVLDFCLQSSSGSQSLRFWNIIKKEESLRGKLQQRFAEKDSYPNIIEAPLNQQSHFKAVVLVASAGYGDDCIIATNILRTIKSGNGLVVAVILKPFSFEGQRRQDEVKILANRLQDSVNFCIDIDIDTLLKLDLVTLDEALKTAYRAVYSALAAMIVIISEEHTKYIHSLHESMKQITGSEVLKALESYVQGSVGFGINENVETSISQAVYDCPFLSVGLNDLEGIVICIISSSCNIGDKDVASHLHTFRQATDCNTEIILSLVHNPDLDPDMIATTVITVCVAEDEEVQRSSILSRLANSIPFVFNFLLGESAQSGNHNSKRSNLRDNISPFMLQNFIKDNEVPDMLPVVGKTENVGIYSGKKELSDEIFDDMEPNGNEIDEVRYLDDDGSSSEYMYQNVGGAQAYEREPVIGQIFGRGYRNNQKWAEEETTASGDEPVADNPKIFLLPVGVKSSDDLSEFFDGSNSGRPAERKNTDGDGLVQTSTVPSVSSVSGSTDAGFEVVTDLWGSASSFLKGRQVINSRKQGGLSVRAASMLESERNFNMKWSPMVEIRYRGGIYKGRCQGGLPEGRGSLTFLDGSAYDGMWRYGKRSGMGSLFFSNGDVFHGSWRDDRMHGKGWLYFHTGERWFANFWKGRANGEGRFYSKSGEVLFGNFQDGWRHGQFLCVKIDGTRYVEVWNEGMLVSSEGMDS